MCEAERWDKSGSTERLYRPDARGRRAESLDDEAPGAIYISNQGYRQVVPQIFVKWEPCYGIVGFTESAGIAED